MSDRRLAQAVRQIRRFARPPVGPADDRALLKSFARSRDEAAFAELVRRHGPLVLGVAQRILGEVHAAEDVFQATFVTLARKAGAANWRPTVGPWLYAVASRLARKARASRRGAQRSWVGKRPEFGFRRGSPVAERPSFAGCPAGSPNPAVAAAWAELRQVLDDELARLPDRLRSPLVLCYLDGHTRDEAATELGWSLAMLKRRLERGRSLLRKRLEARGLSAGLLAAAVGLVPVSPELRATTVSAAAVFAIDGTLTGPTAALLREAPTVFGAKAALVGGTLLLAGVVAALASGVALAPRGEDPIADGTPSLGRLRDPARPVFEREPLPPGAVARLGTTAFRPTSTDDRLTFDSSGRLLLSVGQTASLWDAATGRELLAIVERARESVCDAQLSPDGRSVTALVQGMSDQVLERWTITNGQVAILPVPQLRIRNIQLKTYPGPPGRHTDFGIAYTFSPDGNTLALLDKGGDVVLWNVLRGVAVHRLTGAKSSVSAIAFTPGGDRIVTAHDDHTFHVWDVAAGKEIRRFAGPSFAVTEMSFSADGRRMSATNVGMKSDPKIPIVGIWDVEGGAEVRKIEADSWSVRSACLAPDGKSVFTTEVVEPGIYTTLKQYELATGKPRTLSPPGGPRVTLLAVSPDERTLAAATMEGPIYRWDIPTGKELEPRGLPSTPRYIVVAPDGKTAWTSFFPGLIVKWDLNTGRELLRLNMDPVSAPALALSPDSKTLAVAEYFYGMEKGPNKVTLRDAATSRLLRSITAAGNHLAFSPDGRVLAGVDEGNWRIQFWSPVDGKQSWPDIQFGSRVENLRFLDNRRLLIFAKESAIWNIETGKVEKRYPPKSNLLDISSHGRWVVLDASYERRVTDTTNGNVVTIVDRGWNGAFSADEKRAAFVSDEDPRNIDVWDLIAQKKLVTFTGHRMPISSLMFTPDGRRLISGCQDTTTLVWEVPQ